MAVKVPVFSFEKITDANAALSPEMKSTGEVLGLGANMQEALFKGLVSAGYKVEKADHGGVLISVNHRDQPEVVNIARKLDELASASTPRSVPLTRSPSLAPTWRWWASWARTTGCSSCWRPAKSTM